MLLHRRRRCCCLLWLRFALHKVSQFDFGRSLGFDVAIQMPHMDNRALATRRYSTSTLCNAMQRIKVKVEEKRQQQ